MNSHETLIFIIATLAIAAAAVAVFTSITDVPAAPDPAPDTQIRVVNALGENISDGQARYLRLSITADGPVALNDTLITISTPEGQAALGYRDGDLQRNETSGFYTR